MNRMNLVRIDNNRVNFGGRVLILGWLQPLNTKEATTSKCQREWWEFTTAAHHAQIQRARQIANTSLWFWPKVDTIMKSLVFSGSFAGTLVRMNLKKR